MDHPKKNILFLSSWFPTRIIPTLGNFIQRHAETVAMFNNVVVLIVQLDSNLNQLEIEDTLENNVRIIRVYYPKNGIISKFQAFKKGWKYIQNHYDWKFDLVQLNVAWKEGWQAVYLKKFFKIPFVICEHWTGYHTHLRGELSSFTLLYIKWIVRNAEAVLPVTEKLGNAMQQLGLKSEYMVVPNVVDLDIFQVGKEKNNELHFLHISHLDNDHKNIKGILRTWKKAAEMNPNQILNIGGDGDVSSVMKWSSDILIPEANIRFFHTLSPSEVAKKMNECDALILFSNYENLPLVIIEGMASGMQIIASDVGGVAELISGQNFHHLIARKDEDALLSSIKSVKHLTTSEMEDIRSHVIHRFSKQAVANRFNEIYNSVLSSK